MRRYCLLAVALLLLAAVPGVAADLFTPAAACTASASSVTLPQGQPAPQLATGFLCGTCSGSCSGLFTGSACGDGGFCAGVVNGNGRPASCPPGSGTGNLCTCLEVAPDN